MKHLQKNKLIYTYIFSAALLIISALLALLLGATKISIGDIISALTGAAASAGARIVMYVRLPRMLASLLTGAALSVSGAVIQGVLANKLASPSIIGVNAGAGLAVTICTGLGIIGGWEMSFFAFLGAFLTVLIVSLAAKKWGASRGTVILIGVAVNALLGAVADTITTFSPDALVMSNDFRIGDFSSVTYEKLAPAAVIILLSTIILFTLSNELDVLTLGDENAKGLGMNTAAMRVVFLLLAALLAGQAVSLAGLLSFVGLIVPHVVRRIATPQSRHLLPICALLGGGFVTLCDTLSRVVFAPYELPVGIIMAFIGVPFFLFILIKGKGGHRNA